MKKIITVLISIIVLSVIVIIVCFCYTGSRTYKSFESVNEKDAHFFLLEQGKAENHLDKKQQLSELGKYTDYDFKFKCTYDGIMFVSYGESLVGSYTPDEYAYQKNKMLSEYVYFENPIKDENTFILTQTVFSVNDWQFKVMNEPDTDLPKYFRILGYNDKTNKIAILYFANQDLDEIDENMADFVNNYFKYKF